MEDMTQTASTLVLYHEAMMISSKYRIEHLQCDKNKVHCAHVQRDLPQSRYQPNNRGGRHAAADHRRTAGRPELNCNRQASSKGRWFQQVAMRRDVFHYCVLGNKTPKAMANGKKVELSVLSAIGARAFAPNKLIKTQLKDMS